MTQVIVLKRLRELKDSYNKLRFNPKKTKKANEKRLDMMRSIRLEFKELESTIGWGKFDISQLNLMCPHSGPWCLLDAENFVNEGFYFSFNFINDKTRYVGEYSLLEDKCGIDNLKRLEEQILR